MIPCEEVWCEFGVAKNTFKGPLTSTYTVTRRNRTPIDMGVPKNRGAPKWMVYNGKAGKPC